MRLLTLLLLLALPGCAAWNRAVYGYDRTITITSSEPGVRVMWQPTHIMGYYVGKTSLTEMGVTPFKQNTFGEGSVDIWAVKGDLLLRTTLQWQEPEQTIDFSKAKKMTNDEQCCVDGKVYVGMGAEWARISWGEPGKINKTTNAFGRSEQWVYGSGSYLYFDNGKLTTIQN